MAMTVVPFWDRSNWASFDTSESSGGGKAANENNSTGEATNKEMKNLLAHNSYFEYFLNLLPTDKYFPKEDDFNTNNKKLRKKNSKGAEILRRRNRLDPALQKTVVEMQKEVAHASKRPENQSLDVDSQNNRVKIKLSKLIKSRKSKTQKKSPNLESKDSASSDNHAEIGKKRKTSSETENRKTEHEKTEHEKTTNLVKKRKIEKVSISELKKRMAERLQALRDERKPKDRPWLLNNGGKLKKDKKKDKKKENKREKQDAKNDTAKLFDLMEKELNDKSLEENELEKDIEEDLSFGNLLTKTKNIKPVKKKKGKSKGKLLHELTEKKNKLANMDEDEAEQALIEDSFKKSLQRISGKKVKDDTKLIKTALKKKKKRKAESAKQWKSRKANQDRAVSDKQEKRQENIEKKSGKKRKKFHKLDVQIDGGK